MHKPLLITLIVSILCAPNAWALTKAANDTSARHTEWRNTGVNELYYWNDGVWLDYTLDFGAGGDWQIGLTAKNYDSSSTPGLPSGYQFQFDVHLDGVWKKKLYIPGSSTDYQTNAFVLENIPAGTHTVRFTWLNDDWSAGNYDANVRVKEVSFVDTTPSVGGITLDAFSLEDGESLYANAPLNLTITQTNTGTNPVEYRVLKNGSVLFDWQNTNTFSWSPTLQDLGRQSIQAEVRNSDTVPANDVRGVDVFVVRQPINAN